MAPRCRARVRYRHFQPHPPGTESGRLPVHQPRATQDRSRIQEALYSAIIGLADANDLLYVNVEELRSVDRQFLVERQLISREHAESQGARRRGDRP